MQKSLLLVATLVIPLVSLVASGQSRPTSGPSNAAAPRLDAWKVIGPGGGGTMIAPTISPQNPKIVLVHCDMTGAYITLDGGASWRMFNLRSGVSNLAFDPADPDVIYAVNHALWKSADAGKTWRMIWPDPAKQTVEHVAGDHAEVFLSTQDKSYPLVDPEGRPLRDSGFTAVAVNPIDRKHLVVSSGGKVFETRDAAATWKSLPVLNDRITTLQFRPDGKVLYAIGTPGRGVAATSAIHKFQADGWQTITPPGGPMRSASLGWVKGSDEPVIYAAGNTTLKDGALSGGVFVSTDGGKTWNDTLGNLREKAILPDPQPQPASQPSSRPQGGFGRGGNRTPGINLVSCCTEQPDTAYASITGLRLGQGEENNYNGIIKTTDGGKTWNVVHKESNFPSPTMQGSWFDERASLAGGRSVYYSPCWSLTCSPSDPSICYATDLFRTYMTDDGGKSWRQCHSAPAGPSELKQWTTRGLDVTTSYGVHVDPFNPANMFISYTDIGGFRSADGGQSWIMATTGIPEAWRNTTYWVEYDPKVPNLMWGAFSGTHDLPRPKMFRNTDPERFRGGVATSTDGGKTWQPSLDGLPQSAVTHVLLDPDSPVGQRTLYACAFGRGVYKSTDNGKTWRLRNSGIEGDQPFAWRITRVADGTLYLVVARRTEEANTGGKGDGALYKSTNGADTWVKMDLPAGCNGPNGLAVDPKDPKRMYLAAWGRSTGNGDVGGGVFRSLDGGKTWKNVLATIPHAYDVTIDPANPKVLYVCGFDSSAWRSADGGDTWTRLKGYNFKWGHRVIIDPVNPGMIYITTFGGSVWYGPAEGDKQTVEDIVPPVTQAPCRP